MGENNKKLIYIGSDGRTMVDVSKCIEHIFEENELMEKSVVRNFRTTAADGKNIS